MSDITAVSTPGPSPDPAQRFTHQQLCALHALASGLTPTEAAGHAQVNRSQIYRWFNNPSFSLALDNAKREHYTAIATRFHTLASKGLDALERILDDPKSNAIARIKAAAMVFAHLERAQPSLPRTAAELAAIDQQCLDSNAPHLVVGRNPQHVTDRDANAVSHLSAAQPGVTDRDAKPLSEPAQPPQVTDRDAKSIPAIPSATDRDANFGLPFIRNTWATLWNTCTATFAYSCPLVYEVVC